MRLNQIDVLKGIGILLVMLGHAFPQRGTFYEIIYSFHMPLFFACSGFFFRDNNIINTTIKDMKILLIPWVSFSCLLMFSALIIYVISHNYSLFQFDPINENSYCLYHTIWFLICLFIVRFIYRLIFKMCDGKLFIISVLSVGGYLAAYMLNNYSFNIPFFIDSAMAMICFYHLGYLFNKTNLYNKHLSKWFIICLFLIYVVMVKLLQPHVDIKSNEFPIYLIFLSSLPIFTLYHISCWFNSKFFIYCGTSSLVIMGLHHPIYDVILFPIMNRILLPNSVECMLMVVISLPIIYILQKLIMKYTPFLIGKF